jgi:lipopolysaccharide/colanic/teichoic acid biosynthesis glycosyltransferase
MRAKSRTQLALKRGLDIVGSTAGLGLLAPVLGGIFVAEVWFHGWPPVFSQARPGLQGRIFTIHKFRTMTNARDAAGVLLPDAERMTRFGSWLRSTSLDELPELWNVLKGEMSLVGPRPLLVQYLERYSPEQKRRHDVKPGITGWAQINGRNAISWPEKFALDVWYVDNWSLSTDLMILAKTLQRVLKRDGISADGAATMPEFLGNGANGASSEANGGNASGAARG